MKKRACTAIVAWAIAASPFAAHAGPPAPKPEAPLARGVALVATRTVLLREALLEAGARVRVVEIASKGGVPIAVSLELKDGHVVRGIAIRTVLASFRRAQ